MRVRCLRQRGAAVRAGAHADVETGAGCGARFQIEFGVTEIDHASGLRHARLVHRRADQIGRRTPVSGLMGAILWTATVAAAPFAYFKSATGLMKEARHLEKEHAVIKGEE